MGSSQKKKSKGKNLFSFVNFYFNCNNTIKLIFKRPKTFIGWPFFSKFMSDFHVLFSWQVYYVIAHGYMWYIILDISHTFNILTKFPYWILGGHLCLLNMIKTILFNMDLRLHTFKRFIFKILITFIFYFYFFCNLWKLILKMCFP